LNQPNHPARDASCGSPDVKFHSIRHGARKGNCFDNAVIESFFGTLKAEYFHLAAPSSLDTLEAGVHDYIHYYNHERLKLGLKGLSPVGYRLRNTA
jgi:putative transposase